MHYGCHCEKKEHEKQDSDQKRMRCYYRFKYCGKPCSFKINQQKDDEKQEGKNQDSQQIFEEEEEEK